MPPSCREEVWEFLSGLFQARHKPEWEFPAELLGEGAFNELSHQTTEYEHSINVDLGKTPTHLVALSHAVLCVFHFRTDISLSSVLLQ